MQSIDQQKAVIGTLAIKPTSFHFISDFVNPEMFSEELQKAARFIWDRFSKGLSFDLAMLNAHIGEDAVGELLNFATSQDLFEEHSKNVSESFLQKEFKNSLIETVDLINNGMGYVDAIAELNATQNALNGFVSAKRNRHEVVMGAMEDLINSIENPGTLRGIKTAYNNLDRYNLGWQTGLHIIAGRPGMGKTSIMLENAIAAAKSGTPALYFSMGDMTEKSLSIKAALSIAGIEQSQIDEGKLPDNWSDLIREAFEQFYEMPLEILDINSVRRNISDVTHKCFAQKKENNTGIVFFDYIQQFKPNKETGNRNNDTGEVTATMKEISTKLDIPCIAGSQLNRQVETRGGSKRPQLSDLRHSGEIEQDADSIYMLYRPEYYNILEDEEGNSVKGITELINRKNRAAGDKTNQTLKLKRVDGRCQAYDPEFSYGQDFPTEEPFAYSELPEKNANLITPNKNESDESIPF